MNQGAALWPQAGDILVALVLSSAIGFEREARRKSAGLRTHALVGVGAALFMVVSKYGFFDVLRPGRVVVDPSRVAAQIVTGVGFLGAGVIFVHRGSVKGLTTAAAIWLSAAVGACCGAGLPALAAVVTAGYFVVTHAYPWVLRRATSMTPTRPEVEVVSRDGQGLRNRAHLEVTYRDGQGVLRRTLARCGELDFEVARLSVEDHHGPERAGQGASPTPWSEPMEGGGGSWWGASPLGNGGEANTESDVTVLFDVEGPRPVPELIRAIASLDGVRRVDLGPTKGLQGSAGGGRPQAGGPLR